MRAQESGKHRRKPAGEQDLFNRSVPSLPTLLVSTVQVGAKLASSMPGISKYLDSWTRVLCAAEYGTSNKAWSSSSAKAVLQLQTVFLGNSPSVAAREHPFDDYIVAGMAHALEEL